MRLIPDEQPLVEAVLKELCDDAGCCLIVTTGGTGPARGISRRRPPGSSVR
jgi:molybdopterin adenylyltransferase